MPPSLLLLSFAYAYYWYTNFICVLNVLTIGCCSGESTTCLSVMKMMDLQDSYAWNRERSCVHKKKNCNAAGSKTLYRLASVFYCF